MSSMTNLDRSPDMRGGLENAEFPEIGQNHGKGHSHDPGIKLQYLLYRLKNSDSIWEKNM